MSKKYEKRISELVRMHLATLIEQRLNDPRVAGISVTDVEVTSDTRYARVFYSLIGDSQAREQAARGLESAAGWLRHELGVHLRTRHTPELAFVYDPSIERGARVSDLLDTLKAKEANSASPDKETGNPS
ncbi:MAG: 30S ribosome-binding factor RbfA [Chloroflexi bacterium]|nr:30S ribosome-binding factor RbfA [Chloroflexota bacterium]